MRKVAPLLLPIIWGGIIIVMSLVPSKALKPIAPWGIEGADKFAHGFMYCVLAWLLLKAKASAKPGKWWVDSLGTFVVAAVLGVSLEWLQGLSKQGRHFDEMDIIANIIGTLLGAAAFITLQKKKYYGS